MAKWLERWPFPASSTGFIGREFKPVPGEATIYNIVNFPVLYIFFVSAIQWYFQKI